MLQHGVIRRPGHCEFASYDAITRHQRNMFVYTWELKFNFKENKVYGNNSRRDDSGGNNESWGSCSAPQRGYYSSSITTWQVWHSIIPRLELTGPWYTWNKCILSLAVNVQNTHRLLISPRHCVPMHSLLKLSLQSQHVPHLYLNVPNSPRGSCPSQETEETSLPTRSVENVILMTKGLQERNIQRWMGRRWKITRIIN